MDRRALRLAAPALALALTGGGALLTAAHAEEPVCPDPVGVALHEVHEATGDPAGLVHGVEDAYCGLR